MDGLSESLPRLLWTGWDTKLLLVPWPSTIMRKVPSSLNWTGGVSERSSILIFSLTPSSNICTLLTAETQMPGEAPQPSTLAW